MSNIKTISLEEEQGLRLIKLLDEATNTIRNYLLSPYQKSALSFDDGLQKEKTKLLKILKKDQIDIVFPLSGRTNPEQYDISLLQILLRMVRKLPRPKTGWNNEPLTSDTSDSAYIVKIYLGRNKLQHSRLKKTQAEYLSYLNDIGGSMVALGCDINIVNKLIKQPIDANTVALLNKKLDELNESNDKLAELEEKLEQLESCVDKDIWFGVMPLIPSFTGRTSDAKEIHALMGTSDTSKLATVLTGLPGTGKTSLALYYCYEYHEHYNNNVIWINANGAESIKDSFINLAKQVDVLKEDSEKFDIVEIIRRVYQLFANCQVLFVFDNAADANTILEFLPVSLSPKTFKPSILVTSKSSCWGQRFQEQRISTLSSEDAIELIQNLLPEELITDESAPLSLHNVLKGYPLALQQSIAYMKYNVITITEYLDKFRTSDENRLLTFPADGIMYQHNFYGALMITLSSLHESAALTLINIVSFMDGISIDKKMLQTCTILTSHDLEDALVTLEQLSLIQLQRNYKTRECWLSIHSLVQLVLRRQLINTDEYLPFISQVFVLIDIAISEKSNYHHKSFGNNWIQHIIYLHTILPDEKVVQQYLAENKQHIYNALENNGNEVIAMEILETVELFQVEMFGELSQELFVTYEFVVLCFIQLRKWKKALNVCFKMENMTNQMEDPTKKYIISVQHHIAFCLSALGRNDEALNVYLHLHEMEKEYIGEYHSTTLTTEINIAMEFDYVGRHQDALDSIDKTIKKMETKALHKNNPHYFLANRNKVIFFIKLGRGDDAKSLMHDLLQISQKTLGKHHLETLEISRSLAEIFQNDGKAAEAIKIAEEIQEIQKTFLPQDHNKYIRIETLIASCLFDLGKYSDASTVYKSILEKELRLFGDLHDDVCQSKQHLSDCYYFMGFYKASFKLLEEILEYFEEVYEKDNFRTMMLKNRLGNCLLQLGKYDKALTIYRKVRNNRSEVKSVSTIIDELNIGICLQYMGKLREALHTFENIHKELKEAPVNDSTLMMSQYRLASSLIDIGEYDRARTLLNDINESGVFSSNNIYTLRTHSQLARCNQILGNNTEVIAGHAYILEHGKELSPWHTTMVTAEIALAKWLIEDNKSSIAVSNLKTLIQKSTDNVDPDHPFMLQVRTVLAIGLTSADDLSESIKLLKEIKIAQEQCIGHNHPNCLQTRFYLATISNEYTTKEKIDLLQNIYEEQCEIYQEDHVDTLITKKEIAHFLMKDKKYKSAEKILKTVLAKQKQILNDDHYDAKNTNTLLNECSSAHVQTNCLMM